MIDENTINERTCLEISFPDVIKFVNFQCKKKVFSVSYVRGLVPVRNGSTSRERPQKKKWKTSFLSEGYVNIGNPLKKALYIKAVAVCLSSQILSSRLLGNCILITEEPRNSVFQREQ